MRIVHLCPGSPFGGAQNLAVELGRQQKLQGHHIDMLWVGEGSTAHKSSRLAELQSVVIGGNLGARIFKVGTALRKIRPDILHLHVPPPWLAGLPLPRTTAVIVHLHVAPTGGQQRGLRLFCTRLFLRLIVRHASACIAVSDWIRAMWSMGHTMKSCPVVYNGISLPESVCLREPVPSKRPTIAIATRLAADKGVGEFILLAQAINALAPEVHFLIAGEGPDRQRFENEARQLMQTGNLTFVGFVEDMPAFWSSVDLAAFCARREPFGLRLIEPLAYGVPVLAYTTGAGSDEIVERCRGIVSVPYGQIDALARGAVELLSDPSKRNQIAARGFSDVVGQFSIVEMTDRVNAIYQNAITSIASKRH